MRARTLVFVLASAALLAQRPMQVDDLFKVKRVADPQVSVTGAVAHQMGIVDVAANKVVTHLWLQHPGGTSQELELGEGSQTRPRFSPDGRRLAYQSGGQIWVLDLVSQERKAITRLSGDCQGQVWSPDGQWLAFASTTAPSGNDAENAAYLKQVEENKVKAHHAKTLMYRYWNEWKDANQVSHLFVVKADGSGAARDLTPGQTFDTPIFSEVAEGDDYAWSPDSKFLAFGAHPEQTKAVSTNGEVYEVAASGGPVRLLSGMNPAMDCTPRYSPDGKFLAWRAQRKPGYESDKWELWVMDRASGRIVKTTHSLDRSVGAFAWRGEKLIFASEDQARQNLFQWDPATEKTSTLTRDLMVEEFALYPDGQHALARLSDLATPQDLYDVDLATGKASRVTHHNEALTKELGLNKAEAFWVKASDGTKIQAWVIKPLGFDPAKKYPVALILHGGPQGTNADQWHPRWNGQAWAGRGFLTVMPNPRGSTSFGQKFCDAIRADWNGQPMKDDIALLDGVLKAYPSADPKRVVAAGASYGGYSTNWLAGHYADRFAAFVTHAGIFNLESMQLGTEELWFPRWEFKGWPWESPEIAARWRSQSPSSGAGHFKKPMLVTHGELDYRVPVTEAYQLFSVLQLKQVPSELIVFPDECHFILKPQNSKFWYEHVLDWCERWTK